MSTKPPLPLSAMLLLSFGAALAILGVYFVFLRPPLLPEDPRYMGVSEAEIQLAVPALAGWLKQVFRVLGGYTAATGVLTIALAATSFRARQLAALLGAIIGGLVSIGWMVVINFWIHSDYRWLLFAIGCLWVVSLVQYAIEAGCQTARETSDAG